MVLTLQRRPQTHDTSFPAFQLFLLAICRISEPIALTSIFPYAFPLVKSFQIGDGSNAALYAGILISSFALSEALTGVYWGGISDRIGRKPVLLIGCAGTMFSMLMMGFATNFWFALAARSIGGLLNGNIGVIQTMVGEMVKNPDHEPRAFAVMPFVWSIGTICGPAISGLTANSSIFPSFPYLLPNLICSLMLLISIAVGYFFLEETRREESNWDDKDDMDKQETPLMATSGATANAGADLRAESYGTFNRVDIHGEDWQVNSDGSPSYQPVSPEVKHTVFNKQVLLLIAALGLFCYHSMTYDHLLPIFLQDDKASEISILNTLGFPDAGGLGFSTHQVGMIMSINGVIALFVQGVIFPLFAEWLGVWHLFKLVMILHPIAYFIVPYIALLPEHLVYPGIYACLTIRNFFSIVAYPLLLILIKGACDPKALGKINGLAASAGAAARTVGPPVSGFLYGFGNEIGFTGLAWWASGVIALLGAAQVFWIKREKNQTATVRVPCATAEDDWDSKSTVHIIVTDVEDV